ncbi:MAG: D-glycero-beta-D-manno-heptose-7-phosphate kinase [Campylobacterales bacterium]
MSSPKILVIGDLMIDHYLWGKCDRISPEAPVQVVGVQSESLALGGACNVMNNLVDLGASVLACGVVGKDDSAFMLKSMLFKNGVDCSGIAEEDERQTTKKSRVIASRQQVIRVDREDAKEISKASEEEIMKFLKKSIDKIDICLLSDYGKGVLTHSLTQNIISICRENGKKVLIDPKGKDYSKYKGGYLITPNKKEASIATSIDIVDDKSLEEAGYWLKNELKLDISLITLSEDGMAIFGDSMIKIPTVAREVYDVTGAGDTVLASLGYSLAKGCDIIEACHFANSAAAVVVGKIGSATATAEEIEEYEHYVKKTHIELKIKTQEQIELSSKKLKAQNKKLVFTNGCFDIIHAGHIKYLQKAKELGDVLIVGLNSDASVSRLKGKSRPINTLEDRAVVLAGLESVDYVVEFGEDTPYELIKSIVPDVLVKGADYEGKEVVGSDIAKETVLVEFLEGRSTTKIIGKIKG